MWGHDIIPTEASPTRRPCRDAPHRGRGAGLRRGAWTTHWIWLSLGKGVITLVQNDLQKGAQVQDSGPLPKGDLGGHHSVHSAWSGCSFHVQNRGHPFCSESPSRVLL